MPSPVNFQFVNAVPRGAAADFPAAVLVPGEDVDGTRLPEGTWGIALGSPGQLCLVIAGRRDEVLGVLDSAREQLLGYYRAEHANGLHRRAAERHCPECAPEEMACPACSNTTNNRWAALRGEQADAVTCGSCPTTFWPFAHQEAFAHPGEDDPAADNRTVPTPFAVTSPAAGAARVAELERMEKRGRQHLGVVQRHDAWSRGFDAGVRHVLGEPQP